MPDPAGTIQQRARILAPPYLPSIARSLAPLAIGVALATLLQYFAKPMLGGYHEKVLMDIGINIILAVSLNIVNGFTGQFSIGHAGFMAVGGYTAGWVTYYGTFWVFGDTAFHGGALSTALDPRTFEGPLFAGGDLLFVVALLAGGIVAALFGFIVGLPSLRLRGDYLAIITLGFGEIVRTVILTTDGVLMQHEIGDHRWYQTLTHVGGAIGFIGLPFYASSFWIWALVTVTLVSAYRIKSSTLGRSFLAIRENEIAAAAVGVPTTKYKVRAFVLAAFFAGVAGGLFAHEIGNLINPDASQVGFAKSFDIVIMVVLGGMGSISGVVLAAIGLTILPELLRDPPHLWHVALGAAIVVAIILGLRGMRGARLYRAPLLILAAAMLWEIARSTAHRYDIALSDFRMVLYALSLIVIMILRPSGLLGLHELGDFLPRRRLRPGDPRNLKTGDRGTGP